MRESNIRAWAVVLSLLKGEFFAWDLSADFLWGCPGLCLSLIHI